MHFFPVQFMFHLPFDMYVSSLLLFSLCSSLPFRLTKLPSEFFFCPSLLCHQLVSPLTLEPKIFLGMAMMQIVMTFPTDMHHRSVFLTLFSVSLIEDVMSIELTPLMADIAEP